MVTGLIPKALLAVMLQASFRVIPVAEPLRDLSKGFKKKGQGMVHHHMSSNVPSRSFASAGLAGSSHSLEVFSYKL
eukprot:4958569-Amphidinium_carterae.1